MSDTPKKCDELDLRPTGAAELPPTPAASCDPVPVREETFFTPDETPSASPRPPDELPLILRNRAITVSCSSPTTLEDGSTERSITTNAELIEIFLSDSAIPPRELKRLRSYHAVIQQALDSGLHAAMDAEDSASLIASIKSATRTSSAIAGLIAEAAVQALNALEIAISAALYEGLNCRFYNVDIWLMCDDNIDGYISSEVEPPGFDTVEDSQKYFIPARSFSSASSQEDAAVLAIQSSKRFLSCLYGNEEIIEYCDEATITWNGVPTQLSSLHNTEFETVDSIQTGAPRPRLIFHATTAANTFFAATTSEANQLASIDAISRLSCVAPSSELVLSCSQTAAVAARKAAAGFTEDQILNELVTGSHAGDRSSVMPDTVLVSAGAVNTNRTTSVSIPQGAFVSTTQTMANGEAENFAASLLSCAWVSPAFVCKCVTDVDVEPDIEGVRSSRYKIDDGHYVSVGGVVRSEEVTLSAQSIAQNSLPRGTFVLDEFPGIELNDAVVWPMLASVCESALSCVFDACAVSFCEAKPDDRPTMANGEPNRMFEPSVANPAVAEDNTHAQSWAA